MKLKSFKAINVYGYLDFDIHFNEDVSFLVGGNGSGKTTALKLINALVTPNFRDLLQIPFESACLTVEEKGEIKEISATDNDETKTLKINTLEDSLSVPSFVNAELEYYSHQVEKTDDIIDEIIRKVAGHKVIEEISKIDSPVFLGLDRRHEDNDSQKKYYFERELRLDSSNKRRAIAAKRLFKGSLGAGLMETELLVQDAYRRIRRLEDYQSVRLRDSILISAFQYSSFTSNFLSSGIGSWQEKSGLLRRQQEIKSALSKIGDQDSKLSDEVDKFFNQLTSLFEELSASKEDVSIEWLLNKAQIDRMTKIVEIIDEHKSKIDGLFKPISDFLNIVNDFYSESKKSIEIDPVGQIVVNRPNSKKCSIEGLSSGERQLLIIFAHIFFIPKGSRKSIFIIDEPELSLHLRWQEKFAETILAANPAFQFVLATHSPEIVGVNKDKAVRCR